MNLMGIIHEEFSCYRDGLKIRGSMFRPKGDGPFPTIVVSHEFLFNRLTTLRYAVMFARMGYAAFCFDFNGGGPISQSEGKTTDMTILTEVADLKAVIDYAGKQPYTDMERFHLMGCSLGGFASALVAAELGADFVRKLVLFYPALSVPDDARSGDALFARFDPNNIPERFFCGPIILGRQYMLDARVMDPFSIIDKYRGPVLICFGTKDHLVDYSYGVRAYEAYKAADEAAVASGELDEMPLVWLDSIKNGEHLFLFPPHKSDAFNSVKEFMAGRREVMRVDVKLTTMTFKLKGALLDWDIPFGGKAIGDFFNGTVRAGAHDQRYYGIGTSNVTADYYIDGKDCAGEDATVHVVNRGASLEARAAAAKAFNANALPKTASPWKPVVSTTSKALDFMNHTEAFARLRQRGLKGPLVRIFMDYDATK